MKYLALIGSSATIVEADSADGAREQILLKQGFLKERKTPEARKHHYAEVRRAKPYLWSNITIREATTEELRTYAGLSDVTTASKKPPKKPRQKPRKTVSDRLFGEAS